MTLFISTEDRAAGIEALFGLYRHMEARNNEGARESDKDLRKRLSYEWDGMSGIEREAFLAMAQTLVNPGSYYECHLTFKPGSGFNAEQLHDIGEKYHFHFSAIHGDEVLGEGKYWHLTRSLKDGQTLANDMNALTLALEQAKIPILRRRIEHIIFDERRDQIAGTGRAA